MFTVKANPTFEATLTIVGQGREQKLKLVFRHQTKEQYQDMFKRLQDKEIDWGDMVLEVVESWDADIDLDKAGVTLLQEHQQGADIAIITGYGEALKVERKKN
jgi:hypothetical protein